MSLVSRNTTGSAARLVPERSGVAHATVAAFRSGETRCLSRELGFEVAVLAVVDDPASAARRMTRAWHGAFQPRVGWVLAFDTLAMPWTVSYELFPMDERWLGGRPLPAGLDVVDGTLRVSLAPGASTSDFAGAFHAALEDLSFERVAARPARVDYRFRTGRPLIIGPRYSAPKRCQQLPGIVSNIYFFRPRGFKWIVTRAAEAQSLVGVRAALASATRHGVPRSDAR